MNQGLGIFIEVIAIASIFLLDKIAELDKVFEMVTASGRLQTN
jgi:hypothetical protein